MAGRAHRVARYRGGGAHTQAGPRREHPVTTVGRWTSAAHHRTVSVDGASGTRIRRLHCWCVRYRYFVRISSHLLSPPSPAEANSLLMERAGVWVYDSNFDDAWPTTVLNSITMARPARKLEEPEHLGPRIARASCSPVLCTASDAPSAVPLDRGPLKLKPPRNTAQEPAPLTMLAGGTPRPQLNNVSSKRPLEPLKFRV